MAKPKRSRGRPFVEEITESQRRTLRAIQDFIAHRKYPPSMQELADAMGMKPASAHGLVNQLERKGYVQREPKKARSLAVLRQPQEPTNELMPVPLVGNVAAGPLMLAEENILGEVLVESNLARRGRCFALKVAGESMKGAGLRNGYIVIVRQQPVAESVAMRTALEYVIGCPAGKTPSPRTVGNRLRHFRRRVVKEVYLDIKANEYDRGGSVWRLHHAAPPL